MLAMYGKGAGVMNWGYWTAVESKCLNIGVNIANELDEVEK